MRKSRDKSGRNSHQKYRVSRGNQSRFGRQRASGQLIATVDRDYCLLIYPLPDWEDIERKLIRLPSLNKQARRLQRLMVGYATEIEIDGHGRILLSR